MAPWLLELLVGLVGALVGGFVSAYFGWKSTISTRKDLAQNSKILADFIRGTFEKNDVTLDVDASGKLTLSIMVKPEPIRIHVSDQVRIKEEVIAVLKKAKGE